ncbi:hypothetical protein [Streptomyces sp. URMC 123]|uniref:hypothetical protein n=1 Tax=Streptomyces sp. URMC 123 TaxID=3423403 RepID=UPI003F1A300A
MTVTEASGGTRRPAKTGVAAGAPAALWAAAATLLVEAVLGSSSSFLLDVRGNLDDVGQVLSASAVGLVGGLAYGVVGAVLLNLVAAPMALVTLIASRFTARRFGRKDTWYWCLGVHLVLAVAVVLLLGLPYVLLAPFEPLFHLAWFVAHTVVLAPVVLVARAAADRNAHGRRYLPLLVRVAGGAAFLFAAQVVACVAYVAGR